MKKLQDFAIECGITDRQVQRLLKKYQGELEGHFERKGPNGTWLDETACEVLRSKMKQQPVVVYDGVSQEEEVKRLQAELNAANAAFRDYVRENSPLIVRASERLELAERAESLLRKVSELEADNEALRGDIATKDDIIEQLRADLEEAKLQQPEERKRTFWQWLFHR